ncbi:MAG: OmpA family protein, partial [Bacteroidia bacterium]|nr:OmpA family protein [Bacteroidia bacterium]
MQTACVGKKKFQSSQDALLKKESEYAELIISKGELEAKLEACENLKLEEVQKAENLSEDQSREIENLRSQITELKSQRDRQYAQIEDLTVLTKSANDNISKTLEQLEDRDKYVRMLQAAKTKTDSINLALALNLKSVLAQGIEDQDVNIEVDKTVVFINLSDKMLYKTGSSNLTGRAEEVLGKIAMIVASRPDVEVMVEGYTDNVPIKNSCIEDNWDLSVKRATSVVRVLQDKYGVDPNRLIAAGRG